MSRETGNAQSRATFFRHSAVLSLPAILLRNVPNNARNTGRIKGRSECFRHRASAVPVSPSVFTNGKSQVTIWAKASQTLKLILSKSQKDIHSFSFHKNVVFRTQAEYSYFSADFRLKIFLYYS